MKKGQKAAPYKLENHDSEEKGQEKRKSVKGKRRKREKAAVALLLATLERVFGRKSCLTEGVYLAVTFSKIRLVHKYHIQCIIICICSRIYENRTSGLLEATQLQLTQLK